MQISPKDRSSSRNEILRPRWRPRRPSLTEVLLILKKEGVRGGCVAGPVNGWASECAFDRAGVVTRWGATCILPRCSPAAFFFTAGVVLLFLVGFTLFVFVSANTGSAPGLEVTAEPEPEIERRDIKRRNTPFIQRPESHSKSHKGKVTITYPKAKATTGEVEGRADYDGKALTGFVPGEELLHEKVRELIPLAATTTETVSATAGTSTSSNTRGSQRNHRICSEYKGLSNILSKLREKVGHAHAASANHPEAGLRHSGGGPQQLPARSLVCVLGGRSEEYGPLAVDGLCDVALAPFYVLTGGDTFLSHGNVATQAVLLMAAKAVRTTYGIHVPLKYAHHMRAHAGFSIILNVFVKNSKNTHKCAQV
ncbi:hypothetical protein MRX96_046843 [Rhipicephalus microplus]